MILTFDLRVIVHVYAMTSTNNTTCHPVTQRECWETTVTRLNRDYAQLMVPAIAMMVVFMVVGALGNTLVLLMYVPKNKKTSANIFVILLAGIDWMACFVIHPYVIYKLFHPYDQTWTIPCKIFEFFIHTSLAVSGFALLLVAIDRYFAICKPVRYLVLDKHVYKGIFVIITISIIFSLPLFEFYGASEQIIDVEGQHIITFRCHYKEQYTTSPVLLGFGAFVMGGFLTQVIAMCILYKNVAVTAYRSRRNVMPLSNAHMHAGIKLSGVSSTSCSGPRTGLTPVEMRASSSNFLAREGEQETDMIRTSKVIHISVTTGTFQTFDNTNGSPNRRPDNNRNEETILTAYSSSNQEFRAANRHFTSRLKAAKILFFVTAVFFLSWFPFFVMRIAATVNANYWNLDSSFSRVVECMLNHFFYLNNAVNPIIYTIINKNFRVECIQKFKKHCCW